MNAPLSDGRRGAWVLGPLVVDGTDAALVCALALIGAVGDNKKCDSDHGKDSEENKCNHQVLLGASPTAWPRTGGRKPLLPVRCRLVACSRLKA